MPHLRHRHLITQLEKSARFWPVVGLLGLRQSGKSTLLRDLLHAGDYVTLDDSDSLEDARLSPKNFLAKLNKPVVLDEAQKAPTIFDAIKLQVDLKRKPGQYFLSGSSQFSARIGIRESLTGRIGLHFLHPFTLSEAHQKEFEPRRAEPFHSFKPRFSISQALEQLECGGLPTPLFTRNPEERKAFFTNWLDTTIHRDVARVYGRAYDAEIAWSVLRQMAAALSDGELPRLPHFKQNSRILRRYLGAFEDAFLIQRLPCHETGVGGDAWTFTDTGIAAHLMGGVLGEGRSLSLLRIFVLKEVRAITEYSGARIPIAYYKSARGSPVDLIWKNTPIKISVSPASQSAYDERPLSGAMKALGSKRGILVSARDSLSIARTGISVVPCTFWS